MSESEMVVNLGLGVCETNAGAGCSQRFQVWDGGYIWSFAYTELEATTDAAKHHARKKGLLAAASK